MDRLYRTRLLFGDNGVNKLKNATVMIVGCGAVGSFAAEALARTGVGHLILVDFDNIEESNINRQIFALNSTIGKQKVNVAAQRIQDINPDIQVDVFNMFLDANNTPDCNPDIIIDAIDTVESKIALYQWAYKKQIPWISSMGAALKIDISQIKVSTISRTSVCPLASRIRHLIREINLPDFPVVYSTEKPAKARGHAKNMGSNVTVTGTFGLILANWAIQKIIS
ncbi:MAG: tRNA threonylcarbamoyladenosine dehydratase [Alphaproteobacteria bacterium]|nr:tRNA threonylcarbamoyladenosine dehydratase [Alphaproteobacteria bacterium]